MSARSKARKRALDVLYVADVRQISINEALAAEATRALSEPAREASWLYAREIIDGVVDHGDEIDELIETYAQGWSLGRIGIWEVLYNDQVPDGVAINESVELAKLLSTDDSGSFLNGILGRVHQSKGAA
jgi:N utilization substance protein B